MTDLVIRCSWLPPASLTAEERMAEAAGVLRSPSVVAVMGERWYQGGRSKKEALSRPVRLEDVAAGKRPWRRVSMTDVPPHDEWYYEFGLWNGADRPASATFSITIHVPALNPGRLTVPGLETDKLVLSAPDFGVLRDRGISWDDLLSVTQGLAQRLGGRAEVTGSELWTIAEANDIAPTAAVYACFWGPDRSGENPLYRPLERAGASAPYAVVSCTSEEEAVRPDPAKLTALAHLFGA